MIKNAIKPSQIIYLNIIFQIGLHLTDKVFKMKTKLQIDHIL